MQAATWPCWKSADPMARSAAATPHVSPARRAKRQTLLQMRLCGRQIAFQPSQLPRPAQSGDLVRA